MITRTPHRKDAIARWCTIQFYSVNGDGKLPLTAEMYNAVAGLVLNKETEKLMNGDVSSEASVYEKLNWIQTHFRQLEDTPGLGKYVIAHDEIYADRELAEIGVMIVHKTKKMRYGIDVLEKIKSVGGKRPTLAETAYFFNTFHKDEEGNEIPRTYEIIPFVKVIAGVSGKGTSVEHRTGFLSLPPGYRTKEKNFMFHQESAEIHAGTVIYFVIPKTAS